MRSGRTAGLALAVLLAIAAPLAAQDVPPERGGGGGDGDGRTKNGGRDSIRMDEPPPSTDEAAPKKAEPKEKSEPELLVAQLAQWPSVDAKRAAFRLAAQPSKAYGLLEAKMLEPDLDWRAISGVAAALGHIGDPRALELIDAKLQDRRMFQHSSELLDAIVRIDPVGAKRRLLALLMHPAAAVVRQAEKRLVERVDAIDIDILRDVFEAGGPVARAAAIGLIGRADRVAARPDLIRALRDKTPEVAFAAATALSEDDSAEALELLRRAALSPLDRQLAYAYLALGMRADRTAETIFREGDFAMLMGGRGVKSLDPLSRTIAAMVLADAGYFHEIPALAEVYDTGLVPVLLSTWIGKEYWADLDLLQPLALQRLQRLTGQYSIGSRREWASWWGQNSEDFEARRVLVRITPDQISSLVLALRGNEAPGAETTIMATSAERLPPPLGGELALLVSQETGAELAAAVNESGILKLQQGLTGELTGAGPLEIGVFAGKRQRRLELRANFMTPGQTSLLALVERVREDNLWQRYRPIGSAVDLETFVSAMAPLFTPEQPKAERDEALARLMARAVDGVTIDRNLAALADLEARPELPPLLGDDEVQRLLGILGQQKSMNRLGEAIARVLAKSGKPSVTPLLVEHLITRASAHAHDLLVLTFECADDGALLDGLEAKDSRVRIAALAALRRGSGGGMGVKLARRALDDDTPTVRAEGVRALGRLRAEGARAELEVLAGKAGELRIAAIEALGMLGGKQSLSTLMSAYASDDVGVRLAAVQAFADCREPEAISALVFAMSGDPAALVREVAGREVREIGNLEAASALRKLAIDPGQAEYPRAAAVRSLAALRGDKVSNDLQRLLFDPQVSVADEAAVALASWRDPACVPRLIEMLEEGRSGVRARQALEAVSLESFDQRDAKVLSALYSGWWELAKDQDARVWLAEALLRRGQRDDALGRYARGEVDRAVVPAMLTGLDSSDWFIRRASDLALRHLLGRKVGDQQPWTPPGEVQRMSRAWSDVWADVVGR